MLSRTLIFQGPRINGRPFNVPHPPATNGVIILVRPLDTPAARAARRISVRYRNFHVNGKVVRVRVGSGL